MKKLCIFLLFSMISAAAYPQTRYPERPIRLVFPYPGGITGDSVLRIVSEFLGSELKQPVIVENRPGASGIVGTKYLADAAPNGYTLGTTSNGTHAAVVSLFKNPGYDPLKSFTHIGLIELQPWILVATPKLPVSNVLELVSYARANPGKLAMSQYSASSRMPVHQLRTQGKFEMLEVPYQGPAQILPALIDGQLHAAFFPSEFALAQGKAGTVRVLGVASTKRLAIAPGVPAIGEQLPGVEMISWFGLGGPAGLPEEISSRLQRALIAALAKPDLLARIQPLGVEITPSTPDEIIQRIKLEIAQWAKFVKEAGIQPE